MYNKKKIISGEFELSYFPVLEVVDTIILGTRKNIIFFPALRKLNYIQP
jgi:hypothetical protein